MEAEHVDTVNSKAKQYQECETLITRIEVRIMKDNKMRGRDHRSDAGHQVQRTVYHRY
jgi:hypothetical protein